MGGQELHSVTRIFKFCSGHRLWEYKGPCQNIHGHNYKLEVTVQLDYGALDSQTGMVTDFKNLKFIQHWLDERFDHALILNKEDPLCQCTDLQELKMFVCGSNPTAEFMLRLMYLKFTPCLPAHCDIIRMKLWETDTSFAEVQYD